MAGVTRKPTVDPALSTITVRLNTLIEPMITAQNGATYRRLTHELLANGVDTPAP